MSGPQLIAIGGTAILVTTFLVALHKRWLAHVQNGFFYTLLLALGLSGAISSILVGVFGFESSRAIVVSERVAQLETVGNLIRTRVVDGLNDVFLQLSKVASHFSDLDQQRLEDKQQQKLIDLDRFNEAIIDIIVYDVSLHPVLQTATNDDNAVASPSAHLALVGQQTISEPFFSQTQKRYLIDLCMPARTANGRICGVMCVRYDLQSHLSALLKGVHFSGSGYVVVLDNEGRIMAHPNPTRIGKSVAYYPAVASALRGNQKTAFLNIPGRLRLQFSVPMLDPANHGRFWVILAEMNYDEAMAPTRVLLREFQILTTLLTLASVFLAIRVSRYIRRPVAELLSASHRVQEGDLSARMHQNGVDEFNVVARSFNAMVSGLEERERIKDLFGRYVTTQVSEEILNGQIHMGGEKCHLTILFSDIRNFTSMSERLPPETVVSILNDYFTEMVDVVFEFGGVLDKFIGDGMLVVFGAFGDVENHAGRAVQAALRMQQKLTEINLRRAKMGEDAIHIGIGVHTDDVIVGNIGSRRRMDYTVIGDGVNTSSRVESLNKQFGTMILITQSTYDELPPGQFECRLMPDAELKGKANRMQFYEVISQPGSRT